MNQLIIIRTDEHKVAHSFYILLLIYYYVIIMSISLAGIQKGSIKYSELNWSPLLKVIPEVCFIFFFFKKYVLKKNITSH